MPRRHNDVSYFVRYDIDSVYHQSIIFGGHPKQSLEASFDIIADAASAHGYHLEAETLLSVCQVMSTLPKEDGTKEKVDLRSLCVLNTPSCNSLTSLCL